MVQINSKILILISINNLHQHLEKATEFLFILIKN
jgi:hypothetical protein